MPRARRSKSTQEYRNAHSWPMEPSMHGPRFVSPSFYWNMSNSQHGGPPPLGSIPIPYVEPPSQVIQYSVAPLQSSTTRRRQPGASRKRRKLHQEFYDRYSTISRTMTVVRSNDPYHPIAYVPTRKRIFLSTKPGHWRKGYKSPSSQGKLGSYLGKITSIIARSPSSFRLSYSLNPLITYHAHRPTSICYDLRVRPTPEAGLFNLGTRHFVSPSEIQQLATSPPTQRLLIWHPKLPWKIHIEVTVPGQGITVSSIVFGVYEQLRCSIGHHEYYTVELTSEDRQTLSDVFQERCAGDTTQMIGGLRRVDFLGRDVCFVGLSYSHNGTWELKTTSIPRQRMIID